VNSGLLALALVAGAAAAFNPCGFALLPAYLTVLVAQTTDQSPGRSGTAAAVVRAVRFAVGMTVGFVAVFGIFGVVITPLALSIEKYLPVLTVVIGASLVLLGLWLLAGRSLRLPGNLARGRGPTESWPSQVGYGAAFALASLSCTIGPFLAVTTAAARSGSLVAGVVTFVVYGVGMGTVVLVLALGVATAGTSVATRMRSVGPVIMRVSGLLLVVAGAYVAWYGWFEVRILSGAATQDPVVNAVTTVQSSLTRFIINAGPTLVAVSALIAVAVVVVLVGRGRGRARGRAH
jgi:cytochrome c-type biogenesis protein